MGLKDVWLAMLHPKDTGYEMKISVQGLGYLPTSH